ncbi:MAG TPA: hypothetical protein VE972_01655 [Conexibacter sp.]|nr:hypothetical protein [Conexibacter sp.]
MTPEDQQTQAQPTEEEMRAALEEELKRVRVEQVVTEATVSILNVAVLRAGLVPGSEGEVDLVQVRMGVEAVRALLPLVEEAVGAEQAKPIRDALAQLQLAYVRAQGGGEPGAAPPEGGEEPLQQGEGSGTSGAGPAQQSGRLWVPGQ